LLAAMGNGKRYQTAHEMQCATGIAPVTVASGRTRLIQFRRACPKFLRQTFHEWAQHSMKSCRWAKAYYDQLRAGGKHHHAALRALAFKWQRILFRCWKDGVTYDEAKYMANEAPPQTDEVYVVGSPEPPASSERRLRSTRENCEQFLANDSGR